MYDVLHGYWRDPACVIAVTDDLMFAREALLTHVIRVRGGLTRKDFARFEEMFERMRVDGGTLYLDIDDDRFQIRESQITVAVGGMSTVGGKR